MSNGVGTGWWTYIRYDQERDRPRISWTLSRRVWRYANPYQLKVMGLLATILAITGLSLIPPLLYRDLIDNAILNGDTSRLNWLAVGMIGIPILSAINAEETASASEELNAQAEQMMSMVNEMVALVKGSGNGTGHGSSSVIKNSKRAIQKAHATAIPVDMANNKTLIGHPVKEVSPEQMIPMGDEDFEDF